MTGTNNPEVSDNQARTGATYRVRPTSRNRPRLRPGPHPRPQSDPAPNPPHKKTPPPQTPADTGTRDTSASCAETSRAGADTNASASVSAVVPVVEAWKAAPTARI